MLALLAVTAIASQGLSLNADLLKDVAVLRSAFTQLHPGLYRYNTPAQIEESFSQLEHRFEKVKNLKEAYVALSYFTHQIRCGHTYPNFYNQNKPIVQALFAGQNRVPFHFRWLNGKLIVTEDLTPKHVVPPGTEITAIDGFPSPTILAKLMKVARADGSNDAKRRSLLGVTGRSKYEEFDIYLPLMFPIPEGSFTLRTRSPQGLKKTLMVPALSMADRFADAAHQAAQISTKGDRWNFTLKTPTIGLLKMPTFVMYDNKWDWHAYLAKTFKQLQVAKAKALIIDLRGNEGGSAVGEEICTYLVSKPTSFDQYQLYTRYKKVPEDLRPNLDTWDRSFDDWSPWCGTAQTVAAGHNVFYRMKRFDDTDRSLVRPKAPYFGGKVFLLVDSSNSSATFEFANMVQSHHLAKLIGEPTGGNRRGINGSAFYFLYLPNSQLEVDLPLAGQFPNKPMPDAGLVPDVLVVPTVKTIAAGKDEVLERALRLARSAP
jgi:hypothetical protein